MKMKKKILLATNGCPDAWPTIEYSTWMAKTFSMSLTLLGVIEDTNDEHPVQDIFSRAVTFFGKEGIEYDLQLVDGETEDVLREMMWTNAEMLVVGPLGRSRFRHWLLGRTFRQILEDVGVPILYMQKAKLPIKKILVCLGGLGHAHLAREYAINIAAKTQAVLTLLHVVPPVNLDYPPVKEMQNNWNQLLDTDTPPAQELRKAQQYAQEKGVQTHVTVRHGNVVNQIIGELEENDYDLVCMGSIFSHTGLRQLYAPNVTAEIAEAVNCPILTARCQGDHLPSAV